MKVEDEKVLQTSEQQSGLNVGVTGDAPGKKASETPGQSGPSTSAPKSSSSANFTSAEGKKILWDLRRSDEVLGLVVDRLRELWNLFRSPDFNPVQDSDKLSKVQPLLLQIAQAKPHLALVCHSLNYWLGKMLKHIFVVIWPHFNP